MVIHTFLLATRLQLKKVYTIKTLNLAGKLCLKHGLNHLGLM